MREKTKIVVCSLVNQLEEIGQKLKTICNHEVVQEFFLGCKLFEGFKF